MQRNNLNKTVDKQKSLCYNKYGKANNPTNKVNLNQTL